MPPAGFEPAVPARGRWPTYALDDAAAGFGVLYIQTIITQLISLRLRYLTKPENGSCLCSVRHAVYIVTLVDSHEIFILFISLVFESQGSFISASMEAGFVRQCKVTGGQTDIIFYTVKIA